jgi:hypothetical protein
MMMMMMISNIYQSAKFINLTTRKCKMRNAKKKNFFFGTKTWREVGSRVTLVLTTRQMELVKWRHITHTGHITSTFNSQVQWFSVRSHVTDKKRWWFHLQSVMSAPSFASSSRISLLLFATQIAGAYTVSINLQSVNVVSTHTNAVL